jgi:hypothetical protein
MAGQSFASFPLDPAALSRRPTFAMLPCIACTNAAPGIFASFPYLAVIDYASLLGIYPMPLDRQSRNAPPSEEDIARVAVAALRDPANTRARSIARPDPGCCRCRK